MRQEVKEMIVDVLQKRQWDNELKLKAKTRAKIGDKLREIIENEQKLIDEALEELEV